MLNKPIIWFALFGCFLVGACAIFMSTASPAPFAYDESDYMFAGRQGIWANFSDRQAMSLMEFVNKGLELSRDTTRRVSMSQYVRSTGDISFYRHYHGPVYAYWISLLDGLGVRSEAVYRGSGMILHALGAIAVFWLFLRAFPELPAAAAFVAATMFALNRTALVTGTAITQHIAFEILAFLSLFTLAIYCRTRQVRWWYATAVLLAWSFAAVEISSVLIGASVLTLIFTHWGDRPKAVVVLIAKGVLWFLGALVLIWPKGLLELNVLKGYLYLAYIAVYRKTFSPIGPRELWGFKIKTYPLEFVLPLLALILLAVFWRKLAVRAGALPFLLYAFLFLGVTMVVTAPYVYYHGSLLATLAVITGILFGELWRRTGAPVRAVALIVILGSLLLQANQYYRETVAVRNAPSFSREVLDYLDRRSPQGQSLYVSYILVPPLHYYRPELVTVGYDGDWSVERLAQESLASAPSRVLCQDALCRQLAGQWPGPEVVAGRELAGHLDDTGEAVYAISLKPTK
jgi:hypothetical protein